MRTAAEFDGIAVANHAHVLAVFLAEQSHGAHGLSFGDWHVAMLVEGDGLAHVFVGQVFNLAQFFGCNFLEVREVEAERLSGYQRTFLLYVCAEHFAQSLVQQVSGRVVASDGLTHFHVDFGAEGGCRVGGQFGSDMHAHTVFALGVEHFNLLAGGGVDQLAVVAHLTAHFSVERSLSQHDLVVFAVLLLNVAIAQDVGFHAERVVAHEFLFAFVDGLPVGSFHGGSVASTLLLLLHFGIELGVIEIHAFLLEDEFGKVQGEAVGVVEHEGLHTADAVSAGGFGLCDGVVEQRDTLFESAEEGFFLFLGHLHDEVALSGQFGISIAHVGDNGVNQFVHERLLLL